MQLNIEKHNFFNLEGIVNVKNHLEKLNNVFISSLQYPIAKAWIIVSSNKTCFSLKKLYLFSLATIFAIFLNFGNFIP